MADVTEYVIGGKAPDGTVCKTRIIGYTNGGIQVRMVIGGGEPHTVFLVQGDNGEWMMRKASGPSPVSVYGIEG